MPTKLAAAVALVLTAGTAVAFPLPKKPEPLVTRTYDLKPVLSNTPGSAKDVEEVIRLIVEAVQPGELKPGMDGPQIAELAGSKLEVRATGKIHSEIADLIESLRRLGDVAVDLKAELIEMTPVAFDKLRPPEPGKGAPPRLVAEAAPNAVVEAIRKSGKVIQTEEGRYRNGATATVSARLAVRTPPEQAHPLDGKQFVREGYRLTALPVVSADRRFVRLKLTEQSSRVVRIRMLDGGEIGGKLIRASSPEVSEFGQTGTVEVGDGTAVVFRLDYAPKDKVWLVVLRPTIFIQAEEDELKKDEK